MAKKKEEGEKPESNAGRPTKYKEEYNQQAFKLCLLRATDKDLADFFEVNVDTIHEWKKQHPEFSDSINEGKEQADMEIVNKLFHRANGMTVRTQKAIKVKVNQHEEKVEIVEVDEAHPPDFQAIKFWLTNRKAEGWKDKQVVDNNHGFSDESVKSFLDQFRRAE
jgi:hypothetical protein